MYPPFLSDCLPQTPKFQKSSAETMLPQAQWAKQTPRSQEEEQLDQYFEDSASRRQYFLPEIFNFTLSANIGTYLSYTPPLAATRCRNLPSGLRQHFPVRDY